MRSRSVWLAGLLVFLATACHKSPSVESVMADDASVREKAIKELASLPDEKKQPLVQPLIAFLKSDDSRVSQRAGKALAAIGPPAVPELVTALRQGEVFLKLNALETLGQMGPQAEPALQDVIAAMNHDHPLVRAEAVAALGDLGSSPSEAVRAARTLLHDKDLGVREAAQQTLGKMGVNSTHSSLENHLYKSA